MAEILPIYDWTNGKATAPNIGAVVNEVVRKTRKLVKA
jgi:hypothetical protein